MSEPKKDAFRVGIIYPDACGQKVMVERGTQPFRATVHDAATGHSTLWFHSMAEFEATKKDIFMAHSIIRPVPVIVPLEQDPDYDRLLEICKATPGRSTETLQTQVAGHFDDREAEVREASVAELERVCDKMKAIGKGYETAAAGKPMEEGADAYWMMGYHAFIPVTKGEEVKKEPTKTTAIVQDTGLAKTLIIPEGFKTGSQPDPAALLNKIHDAHPGKAIRLNEYAEQLKLSPEELRAIIESDERFNPIPAAQWVTRKADPKKAK